MRNYFNILLQYFLTILLASCCVMNLYCLLNRGTMYAYTKFDSSHVPKEFGFLECLLFGALISATDPGLLVWVTQSKEQNFHLYYSAPVNNRLKIQLLFHIHSILAFSLQNAPTPLSGHLIVCIRHMWKRKATQRKPSKCSLWPSTKSDRLKSLFLTKLSLKGQKKIQSLNQAASHFFAPVSVSVIL